MSTNKAIYINLMSAGGYYCDWCNEYHAEPLHRVTVEYIGKYQGQGVHETCHEILCPECKRDELCDFNPMEWMPLCAYLKKNPTPLVFRYPVYNNIETDERPSAYMETTDPEVVEKAAGKWCVEIVFIHYEEERDEIVVEVAIV